MDQNLKGENRRMCMNGVGIIREERREAYDLQSLPSMNT